MAKNIESGIDPVPIKIDFMFHHESNLKVVFEKGLHELIDIKIEICASVEYDLGNL